MQLLFSAASCVSGASAPVSGEISPITDGDPASSIIRSTHVVQEIKNRIKIFGIFCYTGRVGWTQLRELLFFVHAGHINITHINIRGNGILIPEPLWIMATFPVAKSDTERSLVDSIGLSPLYSLIRSRRSSAKSTCGSSPISDLRFSHLQRELVIIAVIGITHGRINGLWKDPPLTKSGAEWLNTCHLSISHKRCRSSSKVVGVL